MLPFDDLSPGGDQAHFAHGMSDELISALGRISGLSIKGRTTGAVAKAAGLSLAAIGEQTGVTGVVELTALVGYYTMVAMTLTNHEIPLPEGAEPPFGPPGAKAAE